MKKAENLSVSLAEVADVLGAVGKMRVEGEKEVL